MTTHLVIPSGPEDVRQEAKEELLEILDDSDKNSSHKAIRKTRIYDDLSSAVDNAFPGDVLYLPAGKDSPTVETQGIPRNLQFRGHVSDQKATYRVWRQPSHHVQPKL